MDDRARNQLANLYKKEGDRITRDAQACETLLQDVCPDCRKEIAVLSGAVKCGVPEQITAKLTAMPPQVLRDRLITTMEDLGGYDRNAAGWAVDTWRSVLEGPAPKVDPASALADLYKKEGNRITRDGQACETLLRDVCPDYRKEIAVLSGAVRCGIPEQITANLTAMPPQVLRDRLITTMEELGGYERNAAGWAVDTWRSALEGPAPKVDPASALADLYKKQGDRITRDAQACEALLRDVCPDYRKEIAVLSGAVRCGIPEQITANLTAMPPQVLRDRLITTMEDLGGFDRNAAGWAVDTWRSVLEGSTAPKAEPGNGTTSSKDGELVEIDFGMKAPKREVPPKGELPPPEPVIRDFHGGRGLHQREAEQYVRQALAAGKKVEAVRDDMVQRGYPRHVAEAVIWTAALSEKRGKLMTEAMGAFGVAVLLVVASTLTGMASGGLATLGGLATVFLVIFGCVRLISALGMPNLAQSYRKVLADKEELEREPE